MSGTQSGGQLPGAEQATVDDRKLEYLLNEDPSVSGGKAACFQRLGFNTSNASDLRSALLAELSSATVSTSRPNRGGGTNYAVKLTVSGPEGEAEFRTIWSTTTGTTTFVTAYPWREKKETTTLET